MNPFLTLEDVNSSLLKYKGFSWYALELKYLPNKPFSNVKYDFLEVSRTDNGNILTFNIKVYNSRWTLRYYPKYLIHEAYDDGIISITVNKNRLNQAGLYLELGEEIGHEVTLTLASRVLKYDNISLNFEELNTEQDIPYILQGSPSEEEIAHNQSLTRGYNLIENDLGYHVGYLWVDLIKSDFVFNCTQSLTVGKVNKVYLGADSKYKPSGSMVGSYTPTITVTYGNKVLPVSFDGTDYYFNLDLTNVTETGKVRFKVNVESNEVLNNTITDVALNSQYQTVNTFDGLLSAVQNSDIIRLGANILATSDIPIKRSIKIIGNDKTLNLDEHGFVLNENVSFIAENIIFYGGDTAILQKSNTKVELINCTFRECYSSNYDGLGACIYCDNDYSNLSIDEDFITTLTNCTFINTGSSILHGGQLTITNCRFHNTNLDFFDKHNPAFLYQTDGDATIQNSIFDIDITDTQLCDEETNMGYAQCIFICGETASVNNFNYNDLKGSNFNSFVENLQNNRSHIYAKYYYPQIESCVIISPTSHMEDKSFCYGLSGDDYIYKVNTKLTRASWNSENTTRIITW